MKHSVGLMICGLSVFASGIIIAPDKTYCFQYRWVGPLTPTNHSNCTGAVGAPCIEPPVNGSDFQPPNPADFWTMGDDSDKVCDLSPGNVCITYTFLYNDEVMNISKYCGKVMEDQAVAIPITAGCFTQHVDGHDVRVCVCQSEQGIYPCNASTKLGSSVMTVLILPLVPFVALWRLWNMHIT